MSNKFNFDDFSEQLTEINKDSALRAACSRSRSCGAPPICPDKHTSAFNRSRVNESSGCGIDEMVSKEEE